MLRSFLWHALKLLVTWSLKLLFTCSAASFYMLCSFFLHALQLLVTCSAASCDMLCSFFLHALQLLVTCSAASCDMLCSFFLHALQLLVTCSEANTWYKNNKVTFVHFAAKFTHFSSLYPVKFMSVIRAADRWPTLLHPLIFFVTFSMMEFLKFSYLKIIPLIAIYGNKYYSRRHNYIKMCYIWACVC